MPQFVVRNPQRGALRWPSQRYLTKSRFKLAVECPRKLFYTGKKDRYQDTMAEDAFLEMLAEGGYQVGALAKLRYPDGIEIHETDHAAAEAATRRFWHAITSFFSSQRSASATSSSASTCSSKTATASSSSR